MYLITAINGEQGTLETLPHTTGLKVINQEELLNSDLAFTDDDVVIITSEAVLDTVNKKTVSKNKLKTTKLLKDKVLFREAVATIFDDYTFFSATIDELPTLNITKKMVVKPRKGFFGTAIRIIDEKSDLQNIANSIKAELTTNKKVFDDTILSSDSLLIEDFIEGEEYAVDMFYDEKGTPQILNTYYHPKPNNEAYIHMLYCSSEKIHNRIAKKVIDFFEKLNNTLQVKNYAIHGEFKLNKDSLIPIEMNPLRFGGMGLGNMSFYTMDINSYECLLNRTAPNWEKIWNTPVHKDAVYNFMIAYNGKSVDVNTMQPNIEKLKSKLGTVINETLFDCKKGLVFGIFTSKETEENLQELKKIDFDDFFEPIPTNTNCTK